MTSQLSHNKPIQNGTNSRDNKPICNTGWQMWSIIITDQQKYSYCDKNTALVSIEQGTWYESFRRNTTAVCETLISCHFKYADGPHTVSWITTFLHSNATVSYDGTVDRETVLHQWRLHCFHNKTLAFFDVSVTSHVKSPPARHSGGSQIVQRGWYTFIKTFRLTLTKSSDILRWKSSDCSYADCWTQVNSAAVY